MYYHDTFLFPGANQIGDYDYYIYDDPRRNPLNLVSGSTKTAPPSDPPATIDLVEEIELDKDRIVDERKKTKMGLFGQLTKDQVKQLYRNYVIDFDLFGYDINEFVKYARE